MNVERATTLTAEEIAVLEDAWQEVVAAGGSTNKPDADAAASLLIRHTGAMLAEIRRLRTGIEELLAGYLGRAHAYEQYGGPGSHYAALETAWRSAVDDLRALLTPTDEAAS